MSQLNPNLLALLQSRIPADTLALWKTNLSREQENSFKKVNTPATTCTGSSWRKQAGNAIDQIRRKRKANQQLSEKEQQSPRKQEREEEPPTNSSKVVTEKTIIKNKAVFFGEDCELPYLHSSDAISNLYSKKREEGREQLLFNPANTIDSSYMTSLKSLHIYHTGIDSLRQLGTGWCNLKQLSIVYGRLCDLSGMSSFCSLEYLFLGFNMITSLSDLMFHPSIKFIDLERNRIQQAEEIEYLATIDRLQWVNLNHNPVMRIKQTRRIIQQKLGKMLQLEEYTRLQEYQLQEMARDHYLLGFEGLESINSLVKTCNDSLANDEISLQNLYECHLSPAGDDSKPPLEFVRYQQKHGSDFLDQSTGTLQQGEEEIFFTPLIHFLSSRKHYTSILRKYFENRIYLNMKKADNSQSPAHSLNNISSTNRLNKFAASTRLEREEACSLDKQQSMTTDLSSLQKGKRGRLSLGRTKKLLERFDKANPLPASQLKFANTFASAINPNPTASKTFSLKRTLLKKPSINELEGEMEKKFSKTSAFGGVVNV